MRIAFRTCKLEKYYGRGSIIKAVDELDLEVYEGETFGLLGRARKMLPDLRACHKSQKLT